MMFLGFGDRACAGLLRWSVASSSAAGSKAFRPVPWFAPAALAANKSLKPTPLHRCVQRSKSAVYLRLPTVALRRGLARVLGLKWRWRRTGKLRSLWRFHSK